MKKIKVDLFGVEIYGLLVSKRDEEIVITFFVSFDKPVEVSFPLDEIYDIENECFDEKLILEIKVDEKISEYDITDIDDQYIDYKDCKEVSS